MNRPKDEKVLGAGDSKLDNCMPQTMTLVLNKQKINEGGTKAIDQLKK